jgi:hypothetical protein
VISPNIDSAAAAVVTLRAELDMVDRALESIDRKAALLPAVLGAIAGLFIAPDQTFTMPQQLLLVGALGTGVIAVAVALWVLQTRRLNVGPNAQQTVAGTYLEPAEFNRAVAGSLARAVDQLSEIAIWKGNRVNVAMYFAAVTILLLAITRVIGG